MNKTEKFIEKAKKVHGDKYDYSKVNYIDSIKEVCIICPEHGEFWQHPSVHLKGSQCPQCANFNRGRRKRFTKEQFIEEAKKVHGDKYDYSKVNYINSDTKVDIICPKHGVFSQTPMGHLNGQGCPKCSGRNKTTEEIIEEFKAVHGDKYDYSEVKYTKMHDKVTIICPEHGPFEQTPSKHLLGQGCPVCRYKHIKPQTNVLSSYMYSFYSNDEEKYKNEIYNYICNLLGKDNVISKVKTIIGNRYEIDIYVPSLNVGIEFNNLMLKSEDNGKDKEYHLRKTEECAKQGIKLIQIFEDEYINHKNIVLNKIKHILHRDDNLPKIMGRKCTIGPIDAKISNSFLDINHIQGHCHTTITLGAFYGGLLVGVMSFIKSGKEGEWELNRFATDNKFVCQGVGGKIFKYFIRNYNPVSVKSFADRRWTLNSNNNMYIKLGFTLDNVLKPDYRYVTENSPKERIHKFNFRKKELHRKYNLPMDMTESEMAKALNMYKIWDCGLYKYVWKNIKATE